MLRRLILAVLVAGLIWCGYWFVAAHSLRQSIDSWFAAAPSRGMQAEHSGIALRGFPNRFDVSIDKIRLADQDGHYAWQAPFVQAFALSYKPWHVIAAFAPVQSLTLPFGQFDLLSEQMRGSMVVAPLGAHELRRLRVEGKGLQLGKDAQTVQIAGLNLAFEQSAEAAQVYRIGARLGDVMVAAAFFGGSGAAQQIPEVSLDAKASFSAPISFAVTGAQPALEALAVQELRIDWQGSSLRLSGNLVADANGQAEGSLTLSVDKWREGLDKLVQADFISNRTRKSIEQGLTLMAGTGAGRDRIELPITLAQGQVRAGFLGLGAAPYLR
jgi:hypothetical protein